jgi:outer membrane receptor for ferrienterochelin and colicin
MMNRIKSGIQYTGLKYRLKFSGIQHHTVDAGINLFNNLVHPGDQSPLDTFSLIVPASLKSEKAYEGSIFFNDEYNINSNIALNTGLRISGYKTPGSRMILGFEPRLAARMRINNNSSVKLGYNRNYQYISLISLSLVSTPGDIWKLANSNIKPLIANQVALGYYRNFLYNTIETSVEVYYKRLSNLIEYKDGTILEMNPDLENELLNARGINYGIEFLLTKKSGKIDGWISYTFSRSLRKISDPYQGEIISNNKYYPSSYDKPHDFTIVLNWHVNRRLQFSANFTYSTGRPITLPEYKYPRNGDVMVVFSKRNKYRIPDYHRLDLTVTLDESLKIKKKWKGYWSFSLLNVYGRRNPYTIFYKKENPSEFNNFNSFGLYQLYFIGRPLPMLSYTFIF